jgi:hypothetical protein
VAAGRKRRASSFLRFAEYWFLVCESGAKANLYFRGHFEATGVLS